MFDFSHLPQNAVVNEFVPRIADGLFVIRQHFVWQKPLNCKFVFIFLIGGGGGGSGGSSGTAGSSRSGGGGGGSGSVFYALFHQSNVPNSLLIVTNASQAGNGLGGASATAGNDGANIFVQNIAGNPTAPRWARFGVAIGGLGGTTTSAGLGGSAIADTSSSGLANNSIYWASSAGRAGTFATNGLPANTSIGTASPILGGAGGGGVLTGAPTVFNGAGFASEIPAILPDIAGGIASSALDASSGVRLPFLSVGGAGGGGNNNGSGGRGGNGAGYGAGGGGGGAGVTGQGGRGGNGGPAYACIIAW